MHRHVQPSTCWLFFVAARTVYILKYLHTNKHELRITFTKNKIKGNSALAA